MSSYGLRGYYPEILLHLEAWLGVGITTSVSSTRYAVEIGTSSLLSNYTFRL